MTHSRRLTIVAMLLLTACGDSNGPSDFKNQEFVGTWQVDIPPQSGCWTAFSLSFTVDPDDAAASSDDNNLINIVSSWWITTSPNATSTLSGNFDWGRNEFGLVFNLQGSTSLRFEGTNPNPTKVSGTFRDRDGVAFPAGCSATATARHL